MRMRIGAVIAAVSTMSAVAGSIRADEKAAPAKRPQVEVVFCLDTTGSMSGLIEGAKQKIWSISNQIVAGKPEPQLKVGLIGYRDRGDQYVTKMTDLTDDLDKIYGELKEFKAGGGGDTPESVNQALNESVTKIKWSTDKNVLRIVFLVGDAPPHMDYADDVKYPETCKIAAERGIIINAVQCGSDAATTRVWQEIASKSQGSYVQISQDGAQVRIVTPQDKRLAEINAELENSTLIYGNKEKQQRDRLSQLKTLDGAKADPKGDAEGKVTVAAPKPTAPGAPKAGATVDVTGAKPSKEAEAALEEARTADRASFNARRGLVNAYDLLTDLEKKVVKLEELKDEDLPKELRDLPKEKRQAYLDDLAAKRKKLMEEAKDLAKKRDEFTKKKQEENAKKNKDGFDQKVEELLKNQAKKHGIDY